MILNRLKVEIIPRGGNVYKLNCAVCHGSDRQGDPTGTYPDLISVSTLYSDTEILSLIDEGKGAMPSFKYLAKGKKDALIAFLTHRKETQERHLEESGYYTQMPLTLIKAITAF